MSRFAPFAIAGCSAFLACALACAIGPAAALPLSVLSLLAFILLLLVKTFPDRRSWLFLLLAASVSLARYTWASHTMAEPIAQYAGSTCRVEGQITSILPQSGGVRYTVSLWTEASPGKIRSYCAYLWASSDMAAGELGETLSGTVSFYPQSDSLWQRSSYYGSGIHLRGKLIYGDFSQSQKLLPETRSALLRQRLSRSISDALPGQHGALLSAILLGERSRLSGETEQSLRRAGLSHILALSGLHLSIAAGLFSSLPFLSKRKKLKSLLGILGIGVYLFLAGAPLSMLRAGGMWLLIFLSQLLDRPYHSANALGASVLALILVNPFSAASLSMWYSAGSTMAIIWFAPKLIETVNGFIPRHSPYKKGILAACSPLAASLAAMAVVIPISWAAGNTISLLSPLSTLAASVLLPPMLGLGIAALLLNLLPISGLSRLLFFLPGLFARLLEWLARGFAAIPFAAVPKGMTWILPCLAGTFVIAVLCLRDGGKKTLLSGLFWCVILFSVSSVSYTFAVRDLTRIIIPPETGCVLVSRNRTHILMGEIGSVREGERVAELLEDYNIRSLELAVLNNRPGGELEPLAKQAEIALLCAPPQPSSKEFLRYAASYLPLEQMTLSGDEKISLDIDLFSGGYVLSLQADGIKLLNFLGNCDIMELDVYPRHQIVILPPVRAEGIDSLPSDYNVVTGKTDPYNLYHAPRTAQMVSAGEAEVCFTVKDGAISLQK
ncbi:MAG: ComEC/Rec2 family competence protein [Oscillospiraceae bacterium]|jgi:ComEC/Rec2-related protein|nr:ComEC/Rec2 family competence protein [Oscillospiraceae bacterium]